MTEKDNQLFKIGEKDYGQAYQTHLLAQYQLYVENMEKISDRRQNANNYFITINTVLISFLVVHLPLPQYYTDALPVRDNPLLDQRCR